MIEVTNEMIAAARNASLTYIPECEMEAVLEAVFALLEKDYVSRWGKLRIPIGPVYDYDVQLHPELLNAIMESAEQKAEYMGGTIEREKYEKSEHRGYIWFEWRLRRNG